MESERAEEEIGNDESTIVAGALVVLVDVLGWPALKAVVKGAGGRIVYQTVRPKEKRLRIYECEPGCGCVHDRREARS